MFTGAAVNAVALATERSEMRPEVGVAGICRVSLIALLTYTYECQSLDGAVHSLATHHWHEMAILDGCIQ